ncbi:hypothetical protein Y032_0117g674 [Ancylostoma ceylanicum]|uniref:Uncharacterized protein n=1 Tax=Ancylostoma ceylanicum TaxID=53326 RepID=A0A016TBZ3_9BILA|nr:hypothetical protein Y032_0117g674 [Ancylostoma ceylanicum]
MVKTSVFWDFQEKGGEPITAEYSSICGSSGRENSSDTHEFDQELGVVPPCQHDGECMCYHLEKTCDNKI